MSKPPILLTPDGVIDANPDDARKLINEAWNYVLNKPKPMDALTNLLLAAVELHREDQANELLNRVKGK